MGRKSIFHTNIQVKGILLVYSLYHMECFLQVYFSHKNILRSLSTRRIHFFLMVNYIFTIIFIYLFQLVVAKTRKSSPPIARAPAITAIILTKLPI